jgi:hypothetical protein
MPTKAPMSPQGHVSTSRVGGADQNVDWSVQNAPAWRADLRMVGSTNSPARITKIYNDEVHQVLFA